MQNILITYTNVCIWALSSTIRSYFSLPGCWYFTICDSHSC